MSLASGIAEKGRYTNILLLLLFCWRFVCLEYSRFGPMTKVDTFKLCPHTFIQNPGFEVMFFLRNTNCIQQLFATFTCQDGKGDVA